MVVATGDLGPTASLLKHCWPARVALYLIMSYASVREELNLHLYLVSMWLELPTRKSLFSKHEDKTSSHSGAELSLDSFNIS